MIIIPELIFLTLSNGSLKILSVHIQNNRFMFYIYLHTSFMQMHRKVNEKVLTSTKMFANINCENIELKM